MKVWSLTPFFNELDVLEIRLGTLDSIVDHHVIVEAAWTYAGTEKPLHLLDNDPTLWALGRRAEVSMRFLQADAPADEIPFQARLHDTDQRRWQRENHQRRALGHFVRDELGGVAADDVIVLSDLDEIPRPETIERYIESDAYGLDHVVCPALPMDVYRLNWRWPVCLPVICRLFTGRVLERFNYDTEAIRRRPPDDVWPVSAWRAQIEDGYDMALYGWHLAYMGGEEMIRYKLAEAAHPEMTARIVDVEAAAARALARGADLFGRGDRQAYWIPDTLTPPYAQQHRARFAHLFTPKPDEALTRPLSQHEASYYHQG